MTVVPQEMTGAISAEAHFLKLVPQIVSRLPHLADLLHQPSYRVAVGILLGKRA